MKSGLVELNRTPTLTKGTEPGVLPQSGKYGFGAFVHVGLLMNVLVVEFWTDGKLGFCSSVRTQRPPAFPQSQQSHELSLACAQTAGVPSAKSRFPRHKTWCLCALSGTARMVGEQRKSDSPSVPQRAWRYRTFFCVPMYTRLIDWLSIPHPSRPPEHGVRHLGRVRIDDRHQHHVSA